MKREMLSRLAELGKERGLPDDLSLSPLDAYDVAFEFIKAYWERGLKQSDDLAVLLGNMNRAAWENGWSFDPAQLEDWLDAVVRVKAHNNSSKGANNHA